jgi:hypothetical protein
VADNQTEPIGQQRLQHGIDRRGRGSCRYPGAYVEPVDIQPDRATNYFLRIDTVSDADQIQHGGALQVIEATPHEAAAHIIGAGIRGVRARMDIGDVESSHGFGSLAGHDAGQAYGDYYQGENTYWTSVAHSVLSWA